MGGKETHACRRTDQMLSQATVAATIKRDSTSTILPTSFPLHHHPLLFFHSHLEMSHHSSDDIPLVDHNGNHIEYDSSDDGLTTDQLQYYANTEHNTHEHPGLLRIPPAFTTPLPLPDFLPPPYTFTTEEAKPGEATCLPAVTISPDNHILFHTAVTELSLVGAFWSYHRQLRPDGPVSLSLHTILTTTLDQRPPSPPLPPTRVEVRLPTDHPGPGWVFNHPSAKRFYPLLISHEGRRVRAKYVCYNLTLPIPEILGTMG